MRVMLVLGWVIVLLLAFASVRSCVGDVLGAQAMPVDYELAECIYSSADHKHPGLHGCRDIIRVPGLQTDTRCRLSGESAIYTFKTEGNARDLTRDLMDVYCLPVFGDVTKP